MNKRELELKIISNEFAKWQVQIENLTSLNLYDANLFSENSICDILNAIFDYQLKNVNPIIKNHPSIDLADNYNKIAVQVTSTKSKKKVQSTLDKFFENNLNKQYDELFIIILGGKQKSYLNIQLQNDFNFNADQHILDFKDLLKFINILPTERIEKIAKLLEQETIPKRKKRTESNAAKVKRNLALKKRMKKDFLRKLPREHWRYAMYEPYYRFKYYNVIIRSVDDTSFPNGDETESGNISSWFKGEFWDFYDNGLELVSNGYYAIFDKNGSWDILDWKGDERENNPIYKKVSFHSFLRIPYDFIVDYDMEPDNYIGVPTIYVEYAKDGMPYEEILCGIMGHYNKEDESKSRLTYYFDNEKRKKLK
ncbi:MAG: SMEK domain-containing protein [Saprospiraceae bacterium]